jgi:flagellar FliL protein
MSEDTGSQNADSASNDMEAYEEAERGKKKLILLVVLPLLVLGGIGAGLYFSGFLDKILAKDETEVAAAPTPPPANQGKGAPVASTGAQFLKIPDMTVNLNSEGTPRYLRLSVQLEMKNATDLQAVETVMPRVVDQFQTYLRELRVQDLRGSAGIYRLQAELLARVNQAAYPVEVQDVLFQEILIQ